MARAIKTKRSTSGNSKYGHPTKPTLSHARPTRIEKKEAITELRMLPQQTALVVACLIVAVSHVKGATDSPFFAVRTNEDEPVNIDFLKHHKPGNLAAKILINQRPRHGVFLCSSKNEIDLQDEFCNAETTYIPSPNFNGEDEFVYSYLYENMTATTDGKFMVRVIVRPKPDPVIANSDEATMFLEEEHVHIPVLQNDVTKDRSDVCVTLHTDKATEDKVTFKDVAPELGMNAVHTIPPKAPDCLFEHYDPNLKIWIKGAFCLPDLSNAAAATADYDGDGLLDIFFARMDGQDELWRNLGNGSFKLMTDEANLASTEHHRSSGVAWADVDNDGDPDLYVSTMAEKRFYFYINDGMGHFTEEAEKRGLALKPVIPPFQTSTMTIAVGDYDKDGWLDFYTTEWLPHLDQSFDYKNASHSNCKLLRNLGSQGKPGYFEDVTEKAGLGETAIPEVAADRMGGVDIRYYGVREIGLIRNILPGSFKLTALFTDLDGDGYPDLLVNGDFKTSDVFWNNGDGTFTKGTKEAGLGTDENGMGSTVADVNFDGELDWFITSIHITPKQMEPFYEVYMGGGFIFGSTGNRFYLNEGGRKFKDITDEAGVRVGNWGWGAAFFDFDNDGDLDLVQTNGFNDPDNTDADFLHHTPSKLYENEYFDNDKAEVKFKEVGEERGINDRKDGRGLFVFDYDNDGDLDIYIANNADKSILYRNLGGNKNDFIRVKVLEAENDRESIGAKVYLYSPRMKREIIREIQTASAHSAQGETTAHYGLGYEREDTFRIRVYWPVTNNTRIIEKVPRRATVTIRDLAGRRNAVEVTSSLSESAPKCSRMLVKEISRAPSNGQVTFGAKHVTYYPNTDFEGEDSFDYLISDGTSSAVGTVTVKVAKSADASALKVSPSEKYAAINGVGNNPSHPEWGKPMMPLLRLVTPAFADGFDSPAGPNRPPPRAISNAVFDQKRDILSKEGLNDFHVHFGQLVAHDTDFATPYANFLTTENMGIPIPAGDPWFDPHGKGDQVMRFRRSAHLQTTGKMHGTPREQVNKVTAFLDLSVVYGSDDGRATELRTLQGGKLKHQKDDIIDHNYKALPNLNLLHGPRDRMLVSGDNRVNVQPGLIALHTMFSREHNLICDELVERFGSNAMDDETLFQHARAINRAKYQNIIWYQYLPTVIGHKEINALGPYKGYNESIHFGIFNEFATAAFRFGHSQVNDLMPRLGEDWKMIESGHLSLRDGYFNPGRVLSEGGIEPLIRGMLVQKAQNIDTYFVDAVRNFLFGTNTMGLDLASIGIQRGRDHGIPDYNTVRVGIGMPKMNSFAEITSDKVMEKRLAKVYTSVDDLDLWVGGLAEDHVEGGCVGETFARIIAMQYRILRDGDRFWFENKDTALYSLKDRVNIPSKGSNIQEVLARTTGIKWKESVFHGPSEEYKKKLFV